MGPFPRAQAASPIHSQFISDGSAGNALGSGCIARAVTPTPIRIADHSLGALVNTGLTRRVITPSSSQSALEIGAKSPGSSVAPHISDGSPSSASGCVARAIAPIIQRLSDSSAREVSPTRVCMTCGQSFTPDSKYCRICGAPRPVIVKEVSLPRTLSKVRVNEDLNVAIESSSAIVNREGISAGLLAKVELMVEQAVREPLARLESELMGIKMTMQSQTLNQSLSISDMGDIALVKSNMERMERHVQEMQQSAWSAREQDVGGLSSAFGGMRQQVEQELVRLRKDIQQVCNQSTALEKRMNGIEHSSLQDLLKAVERVKTEKNHWLVALEDRFLLMEEQLNASLQKVDLLQRAVAEQADALEKQTSSWKNFESSMLQSKLKRFARYEASAVEEEREQSRVNEKLNHMLNSDQSRVNEKLSHMLNRVVDSKDNLSEFLHITERLNHQMSEAREAASDPSAPLSQARVRSTSPRLLSSILDDPSVY